MKQALLLYALLFLFTFRPQAQYPDAQRVYDTLSAILIQPGISSHFAALYTSTYTRINTYASRLPKDKRDFLMQFQQSFGEWFLEAHYNYLNGDSIPWNWQRYFRYDSLQPLQYWFLGINAHINGDMHQTLLATFPADTLRIHRKTIAEMRHSLQPFFDSLYRLPTNLVRFRRLHHVTLGMDRLAFRYLFFRWRMRQLRMIDLHQKNTKRYDKRLKRLRQIMIHWDNRAFHQLR